MAKLVSFRLVEVVDFQYDINFGTTLMSPGWEGERERERERERARERELERGGPLILKSDLNI
jgi:hypothetical protein